MLQLIKRYKRTSISISLLLTIVIAICLYIFIFSAPRSFPLNAIISVRSGSSLYTLASELRDGRVIRSPFWFRAVAIYLGGERAMKAGEYYLPEPQNVFRVAWRIVHGDFKLKSFKITIPEGFTSKKISILFDVERFPYFDEELFLRDAPEGYLFPDTYFLQETATASSTIRILNNNFNRKIFPLMPEIEASRRTLNEIIIMASIIEGEAKTQSDMEIISSILWRRLELGLPLQVDASFVYILGKGTKELTAGDLKVDSPYNTYLYKGFPPTPISNPGLVSIKAALYSTTTPYLYFLTADDGTMHYSKTFEEHVFKKQKYIKR
jgi:UPF0755 protein